MNAVPSPCIRQCCLNEENICLGCFRSLPEIMGWQQTDEQQQLLIAQAAKNRREKHKRKYPEIWGSH